MKSGKAVFQILVLLLMFLLVMGGRPGWAVVFLVLLLLSACKFK